MDYFYIVINIIAGFYVYTYAKWLRQQGNAFGAFGVLLIVALSVAVPIFRIVCP